MPRAGNAVHLQEVRRMRTDDRTNSVSRKKSDGANERIDNASRRKFEERVPVSRKNVQGRANAACGQRRPTDKTSFRRNGSTSEKKVESGVLGDSSRLDPHAALSSRAQSGTEAENDGTGHRGAHGSLRGAAVLFLTTAVPGGLSLAQNRVSEGHSLKARAAGDLLCARLPAA